MSSGMPGGGCEMDAGSGRVLNCICWGCPCIGGCCRGGGGSELKAGQPLWSSCSMCGMVQQLAARLAVSYAVRFGVALLSMQQCWIVASSGMSEQIRAGRQSVMGVVGPWCSQLVSSCCRRRRVGVELKATGGLAWAAFSLRPTHL